MNVFLLFMEAFGDFLSCVMIFNSTGLLIELANHNHQFHHCFFFFFTAFVQGWIKKAWGGMCHPKMISCHPSFAYDSVVY